MDSRLPCDAQTLRQWMVAYILSVLSPAGGVPTDKNFDTYGFDSVEAVVMAGVMEEEFGVPVDPMWLLENPTIGAFVAAHASDAPLVVTPDAERG